MGIRFFLFSFLILGCTNASFLPPFSPFESIIYLNRPYGGFSDGARLYVVDTLNHRVLIWNNVANAGNRNPDVVLGQPDLVQTADNNGTLPVAARLNFPHSAYSDGTILYIADLGNHRILGWNTIPTSSGASADFVLGRSSFSDLGSPPSPPTGGSLSAPTQVTGDGTRLLVADRDNHRVLVWDSLPTSNAQTPTRVLGQNNFTSGDINQGGSASYATLNQPRGVFIDGNRIIVTENANYRVMIWNTLTPSDGQVANIVVGQTSGSGQTVHAGLGSTNQIGFDEPASALVIGQKLYVSDRGNNRILVWNSIPTSDGQPADEVIGQVDFTTRTPNNGQATYSFDQPQIIFSIQGFLYVADELNHRIQYLEG